MKKDRKLYGPSEIADIGNRVDNDPPIPEDIFLYKIPNAIISPFGFVIKDLLVLKNALSPRHRNAYHFINVISFAFFKKKRRVQKPAISISFGWYDSYYHFTCECLPKLYLLREFLSEATLVFPSKIQNFHEQWFSLLKIKDITYLTNDEVAYTPLAITSEFPARDLNHHSVILPEFSKWVLGFVEKEKYVTYKKIFVGRKAPERRKLLNQSEVRSLVEKHGFKYVEMEGMKLEEQITLFNGAEQIISVHGAALSNLCFSLPNTRILDLCHEDFKQWCFLKLSVFMKQRYEFLYCKGTHIHPLPGYNDIEVDLKMLEQKIKEWSI